jgi:fucose permease
MKNSTKAFPIFLAFLAMGFGDVVGPMVSLAKETFNLSNFMAQLLPASGFIMFGILSIPLGVYQDKKSKKHVLLLGLTVAFIGLVIPIFNGMFGPVVAADSMNMNKFYILLGSILLLGAGATILQVSGNPIMRDVSPEGQYSSNLSLAQSIKAIGSSLGFLLPPFVAYAFNLDWTILFPVYAVLVLITALWTKVTPIVENKTENTATASVTSCFRLLFGNGYVALMVLAIFLYVGAEVSMSSQVPILMKESFGLDNLGLIISWMVFFLPILIGRFAGAAILRKLKPVSFLIITVSIAVLGIVLLLFGSMPVAFAGIVLVGLGFANIFPLVFSITIDKLPERSNELSGLMVFAIVGGAFIPMVTGAVADSFSLVAGFVVPLLCVAYIGIVAFMNKN